MKIPKPKAMNTSIVTIVLGVIVVIISLSFYVLPRAHTSYKQASACPNNTRRLVYDMTYQTSRTDCETCSHVCIYRRQPDAVLYYCENIRL